MSALDVSKALFGQRFMPPRKVSMLDALKRGEATPEEMAELAKTMFHDFSFREW